MHTKRPASHSAPAARNPAGPSQGSGRKQGIAYWLFGLVIGVALGASGVRYWFGGQALQELDALKAQSELRLNESRAEAAAARAFADAVAGQLAIEESTRKGLEASLRSTQTELGRAREQLAFFDQLLPPGPKGAVSIRALDIERVGPALQYRVLLMRNAQNDELFKGRMQFMANGTLDGKTVKIPLEPAQLKGGPDAPVPSVSDGLDLSFEQFQRSGGLLSLPEGFTPRTVTLNVLEGSTVRVSRSVNVPAAD